MRIGIFSDAYLPTINGVVTSIVTLKNGLEKNGHEVFIVSNHGALYELDYQDNILLLPGINIKFLFDNKLSTPLQIRATEIIKQMNLDLIHVHTEFGIGLFARYVAKKENIPLVYTYHTTYEDYTHYINPIHSKSVEKMAKRLVSVLSRQLSKPAQAIITPSAKTKELLLSYGVYQPIHVIPTGVNLDRFEKTPKIQTKASYLRQQFNIKPEDLLLIFVGRLGEEKNLEMLIESISLNKDKNIKLMIVGGGPIFDNLQDLIKEFNVQESVFMTDRIPNDQIAAYYHGADAFISASMTETQGLTFIEAMACGLPLFASDKEVLHDLLIENENGYFFDTLEELNQCLDKFYHLSQQEKGMMAQRSLELVRPYSDIVFVDSMINLYSKVLLNAEDKEYTVIGLKQNENTSLIELSNDLNYLNVILTNDDIKEFNLSEGRILSLKEMSMLKEKDLISEKVSKCLNKISYHDYSEAQMRTYLQESDPDNPILNEQVMRVLIEKGFIDDERFIQELVIRYQEKGYGLYRITKNLEKYQFEENLETLVLERISDQQTDHLHQQFEKVSQQRFNGSYLSVKNKIYEKLVRQGFKASLVGDLLNKAELDYDELASCMSDYAKLKKKETDRYQIINKLKQKGYRQDSINKVIGESEDED